MAYTTKYGSKKSLGTNIAIYPILKYEITSSNTKVYFKYYMGWEVRTTKRSSGPRHSAGFDTIICNLLDTYSGEQSTGTWSGNYEWNDDATKTYTHIASTLRTRTFPKETIADEYEVRYTTTWTNGITVTVPVPALAKYTVTYNANGGTGAPATGTKYYGRNYYISYTTPTREGYTFVCWCTSSTYSASGRYDRGDAYSTNGNLVLWAIWQINYYNLTYHDTSGRHSAQTTSTAYNTTVVLPDENYSFNDRTDHYILAGWNTAADGSGTQYELGQFMPMPANNVDLYSQWYYTIHEVSFSKTLTDTSRYTRWPANFSAEEGTTLTNLNNCVPIVDAVTTTETRNGVNTTIYRTFKLFSGWFNSNGTKITSTSIMPTEDLALHDSSYYNLVSNTFSIKSFTALRASWENINNSYDLYSNDTGESLLLELDYVRPKGYEYEGDSSTYTHFYPAIDVYIRITDENDTLIADTTFSYGINAVNIPTTYKIATHNDPVTTPTADWKIDNLNEFNPNNKYNCSVTVTALNGNVDSVSRTRTDFISRAEFTIDISTNGDRIGIFQPINDYDSSNPSAYPEKEVELNGKLKLMSDTTTAMTLSQDSITFHNSGLGSIDGNDNMLLLSNAYASGNDLYNNQIYIRPSSGGVQIKGIYEPNGESEQSSTILVKNSGITLNTSNAEDGIQIHGSKVNIDPTGVVTIGGTNATLTSGGALTVSGNIQDGSGNILANKLNKTDLTIVNKTIKDNQTVAAGDYVDITDVDISETGKTPLGVVGFRAYNASSNGSNGAAAIIQAAYLSGDKANCRLSNRLSNNSMKVQVHFYILYRTT